MLSGQIPHPWAKILLQNPEIEVCLISHRKRRKQVELMHRLRTAVWICCIIVALSSAGISETMTGDPQMTLMGKTIDYQGLTYRLRKRITTILILGIDQWENERAGDGAFRQGGQADFLAVAVINDENKTVSILRINRNTMVRMTVLNLLGQEIGERNAQICLAYSYGNGGEISGKLTKKACSAFLLDTPIDYYYAINLDGIQVLNDLLGGIEVTLEDDFTAYDPSMTKGKTLVLAGKQAEYYVRGRYDVGDQTSASRMTRQKDYLEKAKGALEARVQESASFILDVFDALSPYANTDMKRGLILNLSNKTRQYDIVSLQEMEGEWQIGAEGFEEFYVDSDALWETVIDCFYERIS